MSLLDFNHKRLVTALNVANNLNLDLNDVCFSKPTANLVGLGDGNTLIRVKTRDHMEVEGSVLTSYVRMDLSVVALAIGSSIPVPASVSTVADVLPYLDYNYGIRVGNYGFVANVAYTADTVRYITLTATSDNPYFIGTATFALPDGPALDIPYVYDPTVHIRVTGKAFAEVYQYPLNLTAKKSIAASVVLGTTDFALLATALKAVTGDNWTHTGVGSFSLSGAIVRRAGLMVTAWGLDTSFKYGLVIELSSDCTNLEGSLYIHFND